MDNSRTTAADAAGIAARLTLAEPERTLACRIEDFQLGIVRLGLDAPGGDAPSAPGARASIAFPGSAPSDDGAAPGFSVSGRMTLVDGARVDVEIDEPSAEALQALDDLAHTVQAARRATQAAGAPGPVAPEVAAAALAACGDVAARFVGERSDALFASAREAMFAAARDASSAAEEERLLALRDEIDALAAPVSKAFLDAVLGGLAAPGESTAGAGPDDDTSGPALSLVESMKIDDWVRVRRILERHAGTLNERQQIVSRRLSALAGVPLADEGPVSLQSLCLHFQAAIQNMGISRDARAAVFDAFERSVVAELPSLLAELDGLLIEHGALPGEIEPVVAAPVPSPMPRGGATLDDDDAHADDDGAESSGDAGAPKPIDPLSLLGAFAALTRGTPADAGAPGAALESLEDHLVAAVAPPGVTISGAQRRTIRALAGIVRGTLAHRDVDDDLKRRLVRIAPPLLQLLLHDDDWIARELEPARFDPITGSYDREAFRVYLERALQRAPGDGREHAVCLVDVDNFEAVDLRWGRQAGARLLRVLCQLLEKHAGNSGYVARLRGDEFAVLLESTPTGGGRSFADRYLRAVERARFVCEGTSLALSVTVGVVAFDDSADSARDVMQVADAARVAAKRAGGGCVREG